MSTINRPSDHQSLYDQRNRHNENHRFLQGQIANYAEGEKPLHLFNQIQAEAAALAQIEAEMKALNLDVNHPPDTQSTLPRPQESVDIISLQAPQGPMRTQDPFYIKRQPDQQLRDQLSAVRLANGSTTTIRGSRQTGKTSLLVRGLDHALQHNATCLLIDFQTLDDGQRHSLHTLLHALVMTICLQLGLDQQAAATDPDTPLGAKQTFNLFLETYVLPVIAGPIVLAIDEADSILSRPFSQEFFSLVRSWHGKRVSPIPTTRALWEKLSTILVISTEPYLLIDDIHQSPFNVGLTLTLRDFDERHLLELNYRHGNPLTAAQIIELGNLVGGQPYLVRMAFYALVNQQVTWDTLLADATNDNGPFNDHLKRIYWAIQQQPALVDALNPIVGIGPKFTPLAFFHAVQKRLRKEDGAETLALLRLQKAGILEENEAGYRCRCDLYRRYLYGKLSSRR